MPNLSERLKVIFDLVPKNARLADIGTDHAYLPAALIKAGKISSAIACDLREKPLKNAANTLKIANCEDKVSLRLSNGLEKVEASEVDTVVIAGMGSDVICDIISRAPWLKKGILLLLQPMTSPEALREFLYNNGYTIHSETAVYDSGRVYSVLSVRGGKESKALSAPDFVSGKLNANDGAARLYLSKQLSRFSACKKDLESSGADNDKLERIKNIVSHLEKLLEVPYGV